MSYRAELSRSAAVAAVLRGLRHGSDRPGDLPAASAHVVALQDRIPRRVACLSAARSAGKVGAAYSIRT
jgi:hypothetical protein